MTKLDYTRGIELLDGAHSVAICGHVNPDGDCLGSVLAMTLGLRELGYEVTPLLATRELPHIYDYLPCYGDFVPACEYHQSPDVFILVDVPVVNRSSDGAHVFERAKRTMVIDHHQGDGSFADVAYVDSSAAAAGMLVWDFLAQAQATLTAEIATCCYTAIITDTGRFQFQNADARALAAAAVMADCGASPADIARLVYQRRSWQALQLESLVEQRMELSFDGHVVTSWACEDDFNQLGAKREDGDSLIDAIRQLDGVEIAVMLRQQGPLVRGSIRSKSNRDVAEIASKMNGGGHRAAAGFTIHTGLEEAREIVAKNIAESYAEHPYEGDGTR